MADCSPISELFAVVCHDQNTARLISFRSCSHRLDLALHVFFDLVDREACRSLARGILHKRVDKLGSVESHPAHQVGIFHAPIVVLIGDDVSSLVRVHAQVKKLGDAQTGKGRVPHRKPAWLLHFAEDGLPVIMPEGHYDAIIIVISEFGTRTLPLLSRQVRQLVVSV